MRARCFRSWFILIWTGLAASFLAHAVTIADGSLNAAWDEEIRREAEQAAAAEKQGQPYERAPGVGWAMVGGCCLLGGFSVPALAALVAAWLALRPVTRWDLAGACILVSVALSIWGVLVLPMGAVAALGPWTAAAGFGITLVAERKRAGPGPIPDLRSNKLHQ